jgi:uncharacterized protein YdhG (YjbR/CyaY superfamily)
VAKTGFASIADYISSKPKPTRTVLEQVRKAILRGAPGSQEGISYQIPVIRLNDVPVLYFAGWKAHYSLYPASDALVAAFRRELAPYERSKGTIKLPLAEPVPAGLITRIAKFRVAQLTPPEPKRGRRKGTQGELDRVRRLCATLPSVFEKLSHGTPTFFVEKGKGVFAMFAADHHSDGRLAVWLPVKDAVQPLLIEEEPAIYFKPPYVGPSGWVGINLGKVGDDALATHLREARQLVAGKRRRPVSR